jgi:hypothetical protein
MVLCVCVHGRIIVLGHDVLGIRRHGGSPNRRTGSVCRAETVRCAYVRHPCVRSLNGHCLHSSRHRGHVRVRLDCVLVSGICTFWWLPCDFRWCFYLFQDVGIRRRRGTFLFLPSGGVSVRVRPL